MNHSESTPEGLAGQVRAIPGGEHMELCYACGTCVSKCLIQQRIDPLYNPRRLFHKAMIGLDKEALEDTTTWLCSACDVCYPACPQEIHVSAVIGAIREIAVAEGRSSQLETAVVDEQTCVACGLCVEVCPYEAITLVEASVMGRGRSVTVAQVEPNLCMACGLCAASCRSTSIGLLEQFSNESLVEDLWGWMRDSVKEVAE